MTSEVTSCRPAAHPSGLFVAFEGGEGAGKSSQITRLTAALRASGHSVLVTHEPGATSVGGQIRALLLHTDEPIAPRAEALLFAADRAHHVATRIRPGLAEHDLVITDRFVDSSIAYQGAGRTLAVTEIQELSTWATEHLVPDLTVLLDVAPEIGLARVRARAGIAPDRLERETLQFHERVRDGFRTLAAAEPKRYLVLDASRDLADLAAEIHSGVAELLERRPG